MGGTIVAGRNVHIDAHAPIPEGHRAPGIDDEVVGAAPTRARSRHRRWLVALAAVAGATALLAACSTTDPGPDTAGPDGTAPIPSAADEGAPVDGGTLAVALPGVVDGLNPVTARWSIDGNIVGSALFDTLVTFDSSGAVVPRLAESVEPSSDGREWTIVVRPGVQFHDGTALDAEAVKANIDARKAQPLTGGALDPIVEGPEGVTVTDPMTVVVHMDEPWFGYEYTLAAQGGYVVAPSQIALGAESMTTAIGTGPFRLVGDFVSGEPIELERNPDYWGERAHLDRLEFQTITDDFSRSNALKAGDVDMIMTQNAQSITEMRTAEGFEQVEDGANEEAFVMLNVAEAPFDNLHARRALALATDRQAIVNLVGEGVKTPANGPFTSSEAFYNDAAGYVEHDVEEAKKELEAYKEETGEAGISFTLSSTPGEADALQPLQAMWLEAGIQVTLDVSEQTTYLTDLFLGQFQAAMFRNFSYVSPDSNFIFWHSSQAKGIGAGSINFGQITSPELDAALETARSTNDQAARREAYQEITPILNEYLPYVWLYHNDWAFTADERVNGLAAIGALGFARSDAKPWWTEVWMTPGA